MDHTMLISLRLNWRWWFGVVVASLIASTKLLYIEPG